MVKRERSKATEPFATAPKLNAHNLVIAGGLFAAKPNHTKIREILGTPRYSNSIRTQRKGFVLQIIRLAKVLAPKVLKRAVGQGVSLNGTCTSDAAAAELAVSNCAHWNPAVAGQVARLLQALAWEKCSRR